MTMSALPSGDLRAFVVFEPSYRYGCVAALASMARRASRPLTVDVLTRAAYLPAAKATVERLQKRFGDRLDLRLVTVPPEILARCDRYQFKSHFIPEVLFRLYYFDIVATDASFVMHVDLDMVWRADPYAILADLHGEDLVYAVEAPMPAVSLPTMPPHVTRYLNAGLLVYATADRAALLDGLARARDIVGEIAHSAHYLDQDAIAIAFAGRIGYLPRRWNFTLGDYEGRPLPGDTAVLHATGSRKPWFFRGGHPFTFAYLEEMDALRAGFLDRYDLWWAVRRALRRAGEKLRKVRA